MATSRVITNVKDAEAIALEWDALAVAARAPYCSPFWMIPWWRHMAPAGAELRVIAIEDDGGVIGIAPFFVAKGAAGVNEYRLLSTGTSGRLQLLSAPGRSDEVRSEASRAFSKLEPGPDAIYLDAVPTDAWWVPGDPNADGGVWSYTTYAVPAPLISMDVGSYDEWLSSKSSNFRQNARRHRRGLEKDGATFRLSTPSDLRADLEAFGTLHEARWNARGGSNVLREGLLEMLHEVALELMPSNRFRMWMIDIDGRPISAQIFVTAGDRVFYWLGGFDESWGRHQPTIQALLTALEHSFEIGDRIFDLGGGGQHYKYRFTDREEHLRWAVAVPRGRRYLMNLVRLSPLIVKTEMSRRLSEDTKKRLKGLVRRG